MSHRGMRRLGAEPIPYDVNFFLWRDPIPFAYLLRLDCDPFVFARRYLRLLAFRYGDEPWTRAEIWTAAIPFASNERLVGTVRNRWRRATRQRYTTGGRVAAPMARPWQYGQSRNLRAEPHIRVIDLDHRVRFVTTGRFPKYRIPRLRFKTKELHHPAHRMHYTFHR